MSTLAEELTRAMQGIFEHAAPAERPDFSAAFIESLSPRTPADASPVPEPEPFRATPRFTAEPDRPRYYGRRSRRSSFNPNWRKVEAIDVVTNHHTGNIELTFPAKPVEAVRNQLKAAGWRWSGATGCWYHSNTVQAMQFARTIAGQ